MENNRERADYIEDECEALEARYRDISTDPELNDVQDLAADADALLEMIVGNPDLPEEERTGLMQLENAVSAIKTLGKLLDDCADILGHLGADAAAEAMHTRARRLAWRRLEVMTENKQRGEQASTVVAADNVRAITGEAKKALKVIRKSA